MGNQLHTVLVMVIMALLSSAHAYLPTYYMDEWCSTTLDLGVQGIQGGRLLLRPPSRGMRFLTCFVFLRAPAGRRLSFTFKGFDVQSVFDCEGDHLQIFDDDRMGLQLTGRMCNEGLLPEGMYTSTGRDATVRLVKRRYLDDQMELIFTAFHLGPCASGEFHCGNSHCIADSLYCNDYDNCGDGSDICLLDTPAIIAVIISAIILVILIAVIVAALLYRRQQHHRMEKLRMRQYVVVQDGKGRPVVLQEDLLHYVDAWDKKSSIHDYSSTLSSRLSKDGEKPQIIFNTSRHEEDTLTKKPLGSSSLKWKHRDSGKSSHPTSSLKSSKSKKSKSENGVHDIYAVPKKSNKFGWRRKPSSVKYINSPQMQEEQSVTAFFIDPPTLTVPNTPEKKGDRKGGKRGTENRDADGMTESKTFVNEGMREQAESEMPLHTLDPTALPGADRHLRVPDIYDHVMSFRSYATPDQKRKERVVYLYPGGHPGYSRLNHHGPQEVALSDGVSLHSSRSSLLKL